MQAARRPGQAMNRGREELNDCSVVGPQQLFCREWKPCVSGATYRSAKILRRYSDDGERHAAKTDLFANQLRVCAEPVLPNAIGDYHHRLRLAAMILFVDESAPKLHRHAQRAEIIPADVIAIHLVPLGGGRIAETCGHYSAKRLRVLRKITVLRDRETARVLSRHSKHADHARR